MAIPPCAPIDVNPSATTTWPSDPRKSSKDPVPNSARTASKPPPKRLALPVNDAPFTKLLYRDPDTGRRTRSRILAELAQVRFESCPPIRTFPAYRGRRSHQGLYWFSRSLSQVHFESRFEKTALMVLDFEGDAVAVSSNPFWLLWPKGAKPVRHAPDFFVRCRDRTVLIVDVKPTERMTDKDRAQHARTSAICRDLGWKYREFITMDDVVERNLRLLGAYRHPRFALPTDKGTLIASQVRLAGTDGLRLPDLIDSVAERAGITDDRVLCGVYHMLWNGQIHVNLNYPLTWNSPVRP